MKTFFKYLFVVLLVVGVLGVLIGIKALQIGALIEAGEADPGVYPETVAVGTVTQDTWETLLPSIGTVTGVDGVEVRTEVAGVIAAIRFTPGQRVEQGAVLVELDASIEKANLKQAEAAADLAEVTLGRAERLVASGTIPVADLDQARTAMAAVDAEIAALKAVLEKKTIKAPFGGYLGIKRIRVGQYVNPGDRLVSLQSLDPVFVEFSMPQGQFAKLTPGLTVRARNEAYPDRTFRGRLTAIDPAIDATTRNVRAQATFPNPGHELRSGMYVDVEIVLPGTTTVNLIPSTAILYAPFGNTVFVVNEPGEEGAMPTVTQQIVRTGRARGDFVEVLQGLELGQRIVTMGAFKLSNGMPIVESDTGIVPPSQDPQVEDS